jgi:DNA replication and repair protein RecF
LTGRNGAGKTNMLEALNLICGWGSFYNAGVKELYTWNSEKIGKKSGNIEIYCKASGEDRIESEILISSRISARVNKERVSFTELRSHIPAICFLPGDMNIIDGSPGIRRVFIDKLCSMLSIPYAKRLSDYKRLVRHRIKLLRMGKSPDITTQLISSLGSWIWSIRESVINMLDEYVSIKSSSKLSPYPLRIKHKPGGIPENIEGCVKPQITKSEFIERLEFYSEREQKAKIPFVGPHRDDIMISVSGNKDKFSDERCSASILSRGQKRRAVISLLLASGQVLELKLKRKPIFLFDEIFSELDDEAKQIIVHALIDTGWQIFASSAESAISLLNCQGKVYNLSDGDIL